jgi:segregation and condensation protein B
MSEQVSEQVESPQSDESSVDTAPVEGAAIDGAVTAAESAAEKAEGVESPARPSLSVSERVALLEALLLASGEPLSLARIQELMGGTKAEVLELADLLQAALASEARGIEVVVVAEKLQLRTKAAFADYVRQLMAVRPRKLSQAALETLSVIAYQQPVVKSEIDKIRGVDVAPTVKTLLERGLVKILGYQASVGQPALYGTTEVFLQVFGLPSLSALPAIQDLKALVQEPGEASSGEDEDADESPPELPIVEQPVPDVN